MKAELLRREKEHYEKQNNIKSLGGSKPETAIEDKPEESVIITEVSKFDDADDLDSSEESDRCHEQVMMKIWKFISFSGSEDSEDEEAELLRELERIKNEREEQRLAKVGDSEIVNEFNVILCLSSWFSFYC